MNYNRSYSIYIEMRRQTEEHCDSEHLRTILNVQGCVNNLPKHSQQAAHVTLPFVFYQRERAEHV